MKGRFGMVVKKRTILTVLSIVCVSSSCVTMNPPTYELPKVSYDTTIAMVPIGGFRIQMSARMAKQIAKEQGYKTDRFRSRITFDDIINAGPIENNDIFGSSISIVRSKETLDLDKLSTTDDVINLGFNYGKVETIERVYIFFQRQQCEELLALYLKMYPRLELSKEGVSDRGREYRFYSYKPNERASVVVEIQMLSENGGIFRISVLDFNYSQDIRNQEYLERMGRAIIY